MVRKCHVATDTFSAPTPTVITQLCAELEAITKTSTATPGCQVLAALISAARCARQAGISAPVAAALLTDYISRDGPD